VCLQVTPAALQARDELLGAAGIDFEIFCDLLECVVGADRALPRIDFAGHEFLRERQTSGLAAGAAIGAGQQLVGRFYAGIFVYLQEALRDREDRAEEKPDPNHYGRRYE
jgi:hypothetical protein